MYVILLASKKCQVEGNKMTPEHTLISEALAEIDNVRVVQVASILEAMFEAVDEVSKNIDRIEFTMDSIEITAVDGDQSVYASMYKPDELESNIDRLTDLIKELIRHRSISDLTIATDILKEGK